MNNKKKLLVIALGGNALLKRGERLDYFYMQRNITNVAKIISQIAHEYKIIIVHGNGPQVGLLALQASNYKDIQPYPFDVLNAESQGMIGYPLQQAIGNFKEDMSIVTVITQVIVDQGDPAFNLPTKFIGAVYNKEESENLMGKESWAMKQDGEYWRRVVPSPKPIDIIEMTAISTLVNSGMIVIAGGGGGIPCIRKDSLLTGVEAVVDKDYTAALLAKRLKADKLVILTDIDAVYDKFGRPDSEPIKKITAANLKEHNFPMGSMLPKVEAACDFVLSTGNTTSIGALDKLLEILNNKSGTLISYS